MPFDDESATEPTPQHEAANAEVSGAGEPKPRHEANGQAPRRPIAMHAVDHEWPGDTPGAQRTAPQPRVEQPTESVPTQRTQAHAAQPTRPQPRAAATPANPAQTKEQPKARAQRAAAPAPTVEPSPSQNSAKRPKSPKAGHPFWVGLVGGLLGAAVVCAVLMGVTGAFGGSGADPVWPTTSNTGTIDINTSGEDVTTAEAVAAKCLPSVASITVTASSGDGVGSGVVLDTEGNILTNYHVVEGAQAIVVTLNNQSYEATLVGDDESSDLAVVKIDPGDTKLTPMEVGDSSALTVGEWVMSIGSPFGLEQSVTTGIVSSLYRSTILQGTSGNTIYTNLIQTDAAINPGNSGGALVNAKGQLVGINSTIMSTSGSSAGIGFAIPSNYAAHVADQIIAGKVVEHAYLGANVATVTAQNAARYHLAVSQGAYIVGVVDGGPAAEAGLQEGDVVTKLGDEAVTSADGLILAVRGHSVGDTVDLTYYRGSEEKTVTIKLGSDASNTAKEEERSSSLDTLPGAAQ